MYPAGSGEPALFVLCGGLRRDLRDVFDGYALTGVGFDVVQCFGSSGISICF